MFIFKPALKQLKILATNSLTIWQQPQPLLTRAKLSWRYQQQCYRVLQNHVSACLSELIQLPIQATNTDREDNQYQILPMIFALQGQAGQTLGSGFLLQNDQDSEVEFSLQVESIRSTSTQSISNSAADSVKNQHDPQIIAPAIDIIIQPAYGRLLSGGAEPIQITVRLHDELAAGDYLVVLRIHGFVEQACHLQIQVQTKVIQPTSAE